MDPPPKKEKEKKVKKKKKMHVLCLLMCNFVGMHLIVEITEYTLLAIYQ